MPDPLARALQLRAGLNDMRVAFYGVARNLVWDMILIIFIRSNFFFHLTALWLIQINVYLLDMYQCFSILFNPNRSISGWDSAPVTLGVFPSYLIIPP